MAITRTPIIDDDGTGTTGTVIDNAWKTELYTQMDAAYPPAYYGSWTPTDVSGAGLVFPTAVGQYGLVGRVATLWFQVVYPATANSAPAYLGGLPWAVRSPAGGYQSYGTQRIWYTAINGLLIQVLDPVSSAPITNAQMSGANVIVTLSYFTDVIP
jgi:hypothetical protein